MIFSDPLDVEDRMDILGQIGNAFAIPTPFVPLISSNQEIEVAAVELDGWGDLENLLESEKLLHAEENTFVHLKYQDLELPDLPALDYGSLDSPLSTRSCCSTPTGGDSNINGEPEMLTEDPWSIPDLLIHKNEVLSFKDWDGFYDKNFTVSPKIGSEERGTRSLNSTLGNFDQVYQNYDHSKPDRIGKRSLIMQSLLLLASGKDSGLFRYVDTEKSFQPLINDEQPDDLLAAGSFDLIQDMIQYGNKIRRIENFVSRMASSRIPSPTMISLSNACTTVLALLETSFMNIVNQTDSIYELRSALDKPSQILSCLDLLTDGIETISSDLQLLTEVYLAYQRMTCAYAGVEQVICEVFIHISRPWHDLLRTSLGFCARLPSRIYPYLESLDMAQHETADSYNEKTINTFQDENGEIVLPDFIAERDKNSIIAIIECLQLLRAHKPEHPLVRPELIDQNSSASIELHFSWQDAENLTRQAKRYESQVSSCIQVFQESQSASNQPRARNEVSDRQKIGFTGGSPGIDIIESIATIESLGDHTCEHTSMLAQSILQFINSGENHSGVESLALSPFPSHLYFSPVLLSQASLVNQACLRLLFKEHKLRLHLNFLYRYNLLGDGKFALQLSHALFDSDLESSGLSRDFVSKLRSQESRKFVSSELQPALTGIISDSCARKQFGRDSSYLDNELPGEISFAVDTMFETDDKRRLDPDSAQALNFLRLQYTPPPPLNAVVTLPCLGKYRLLFQTLLRGARLLFVVNEFFGTVGHRTPITTRVDVVIQRFKIEAYHFVSTICGHFSNQVSVSWEVFAQRLEEIEEHVSREQLGEHDGIQSLRDFHQVVLNRIMSGLLLDPGQEMQMALLEQIFGSILIFARFLRNRLLIEVDQMRDDLQVEELYRQFKAKVQRFLGVCRELRETSVGDGADFLQQLLLRLELSGYYARVGGKGYQSGGSN